ncbi:amino acid ABC transporter permease [Devosia sp. 1566]|jgi:polar amino acid transport system permease protein|uniref:amino acid ABC transporter permease n=1 Tax=Devosia sp. 1566 TaxID=2499144 RepID=UPI000FD87A95|nr:amino acid ABC transporter permease [Devosia sp. 1566]MDF2798110.1 Amino acid transporter, permease protein region, His/Glu/Gln/Arg/opine family [Devosia sp.]
MFRPFGPNEILYIVSAVQWTLLLSAIAFAGGALGGIAVALGRVSKKPWLRYLALAFIRVFQGTPLLMQLFLVYFGLSIMGVGINPWIAAAVALTLHASAYLGEIWRGCIEAVPSGQGEASYVLGLNYWDSMRYVILPQAAKISVAPTVGFLVQLIKGTSLASIIGFVELTRAGQIINNATFQPLLVFSLVGALYFILCWPLSMWARHLEGRFAVATTR